MPNSGPRKAAARRGVLTLWCKTFSLNMMPPDGFLAYTTEMTPPRNYHLNQAELSIIENAILTHPDPVTAERCFALYLLHNGEPQKEIIQMVGFCSRTLANMHQRFLQGELPALESMIKYRPYEKSKPEPEPDDTIHTPIDYPIGHNEAKRLALAAVQQALEDACNGDQEARSWVLDTGAAWLEAADIPVSPDRLQACLSQSWKDLKQNSTHPDSTPRRLPKVAYDRIARLRPARILEYQPV